MTRRIVFLSLTATLLIGTTGCHGFLHRHKKASASVSSAPSADVAHEFRQRWIAKRVSDLTAGGMPAEQAREQAENEYARKYVYLSGTK